MEGSSSNPGREDNEGNDVDGGDHIQEKENTLIEVEESMPKGDHGKKIYKNEIQSFLL